MKRRLVDIIELAEYLGISKHTLYTWVSQRRIPFHKVGRLTKFDFTEIDKWIDSLPGVDVPAARLSEEKS